MINLDSIYSKTLSEKKENTCLGTIYIRLILNDELSDLVNKQPFEQVAFCVLDENGERHFDDEKAKLIKEKMPLAHIDEICELIMSVNKFGISVDEIKKN